MKKLRSLLLQRLGGGRPGQPVFPRGFRQQGAAGRLIPRRETAQSSRSMLSGPGVFTLSEIPVNE